MSEYSGSVSTLNSIVSRASSEASRALSTLAGMIGPGGKGVASVSEETALKLQKPSLEKPVKFSDILGYEDDEDERIIWLNKEVDGFVNKFFPALANCLKTIPEDWLCGVIGGTKPFGMDQTVFEAIWQRARDRNAADSRTQLASFNADVSARGFALPTGALLAQRNLYAKQSADKVAEVNREAMIEEAKIKKEILLFAEEQALRYKLGLMQVLGDFYKAWVNLPDLATQQLQIRAQAYAAFYNALGNYYNVEIAFEKLRLESAELSSDIKLRKRQLDIQEDAAEGNIAGGIGSAAQAFGAIAGQASSAMGTLVAQIESI